MGKTTKLVVLSASIFLFFNASLVIFRPATRPREYRVSATDFSHASAASSADCNCSGGRNDETEVGKSILTPPTVNYSVLATEIPQIGDTEPSTTFSRLGTQLHLDYAQRCPRGSLMLDPHLKTSVPEHLDCPTLFIVGARKAGTTSLYQYLSRHPKFNGIHLDKGPSAGETYYFSAHFMQENWDWNKYKKYFQATKWYMTGDSSVGNLVNCKVPERIWRSCGKQAKIVILLRDPVKRFESNFLLRMRLGKRQFTNNTRASTVVEFEIQSYIKASLNKGVGLASITLSSDKLRCLFHPSRNMVFEGLYYVHVMNWLCNFPPENILIINSEEFFEKTATILEQVTRFLGLESFDNDTAKFVTSTVYNKGMEAPHSYQELSELDKNKLLSIYKFANTPLLQLLDWKHVKWNGV